MCIYAYTDPPPHANIFLWHIFYVKLYVELENIWHPNYKLYKYGCSVACTKPLLNIPKIINSIRISENFWKRYTDISDIYNIYLSGRAGSFLSLVRITVKVQQKIPKVARKRESWTGIIGASNLTTAVNLTKLALIFLLDHNWDMV